MAADARVVVRRYNYCVLSHGMIVVVVIIFIFIFFYRLYYYCFISLPRFVCRLGKVRGRARELFSIAHARVGCRSTRRNGLWRGRRSGRSQDNNMTYSLREMDEWRWCHLSRDTLTVITSTQGPSAWCPWPWAVRSFDPPVYRVRRVPGTHIHTRILTRECYRVVWIISFGS